MRNHEQHRVRSDGAWLRRHAIAEDMGRTLRFARGLRAYVLRSENLHHRHATRAATRDREMKLVIQGHGAGVVQSQDSWDTGPRRAFVCKIAKLNTKSPVREAPSGFGCSVTTNGSFPDRSVCGCFGLRRRASQTGFASRLTPVTRVAPLLAGGGTQSLVLLGRITALVSRADFFSAPGGLNESIEIKSIKRPAKGVVRRCDRAFFSAHRGAGGRSKLWRLRSWTGGQQHKNRREIRENIFLQANRHHAPEICREIQGGGGVAHDRP